MYPRLYSNLYTFHCPWVGLIKTEKNFKIIVLGRKINHLFTRLHHRPFTLLLHWSSSNPLKERIAHFYSSPSMLLKQCLASFFLSTLSLAPHHLMIQKQNPLLKPSVSVTLLRFAFHGTVDAPMLYDTVLSSQEATNVTACLRSAVILTELWLISRELEYKFNLDVK